MESKEKMQMNELSEIEAMTKDFPKNEAKCLLTRHS